MPVIFSEKTDQNIALCVWHITESEEQLLKGLLLTEEDENEILSLRLPKRRLERIACRKALAFLLSTNKIAVYYGKNGEPLMDNLFISFSHSGEFAAAAISYSSPIGIDIEKERQTIITLQNKFITPKELLDIDSKKLDDVHYFWGAKEAIYKMYPEKHLDFLEDIAVNIKEKQAFVTDGEKSIQLYNYKIEDLYILLATVKK